MGRSKEAETDGEAGVILAVLLALAQANPTPQSAGSYLNGNELYDQCQRPESTLCLAYVMGIYDGHLDAVAQDRARRMVCLTGSVEAQQLKDVVTRYLRDHPETRHATAASIALYALGQAFPCRQLPLR